MASKRKSLDALEIVDPQPGASSQQWVSRSSRRVNSDDCTEDAGERAPLCSIENLISDGRGAIREGDAFSVLKHSPFALRGYEFSLCDGAIDCKNRYDTEMSYADRFWKLECQLQRDPGSANLGLLEIKSSTQTDHPYPTSVAQLHRVVAYVLLRSADASWVDFVPNFFQVEEAVESDPMELPESEKRKVGAAFATRSRLPATAHGMIDQSTSPYRMPLCMLPEAISRARAHVRREAVYTNPWTKVSFPDWRPVTVTHNEWLKPSLTAHRSACDAALEIYRHLAHRGNGLWRKLDFVGLQPRLGDFKLVSSSNASLRPDGHDQRIVQHKRDVRVHSKDDVACQLRIARNDGDGWTWFFRPQERFDFFLYELQLSQLPNPRPRIEFFFLPEEVIPDEFYTTLETDVDFNIPAFAVSKIGDKEGRKGYKVYMDEDGRWVDHIRDIIEGHPHPRKPGPRPSRKEKVVKEKRKSVATEPAPITRNLQDRAQGGHRRTMDQGHRQFFYKIMARCASERSGLLVVLSRNHPLGDFAYTRYRWSKKEQEAYKTYYRPPQFLHTLPADLDVIPIIYYTRLQECSHSGPSVTASEFRRINSCSRKRLIIWDLGGADTAGTAPLAVIPSEDVRVSEAQRVVFQTNFGMKSDVWKVKTPTLSALLCTGLHAGEYGLSSGGPLAFCEDGWKRIHKFLESLTRSDIVEHPHGVQRDTFSLRCTVRDLHQRLVLEHMHSTPPRGTATVDEDE